MIPSSHQERTVVVLHVLENQAAYQHCLVVPVHLENSPLYLKFFSPFLVFLLLTCLPEVRNIKDLVNQIMMINHFYKLICCFLQIGARLLL